MHVRQAATLLAVAALPLTLAGCGSQTPPAATQKRLTAVQAWLMNGGLRREAAISSDAAALTFDTGRDAAAMRGDCQRMATDAASAQKMVAVPDPQLQQKWVDALSSYAAGAAQCTVGNAAIVAANAQMQQVAVRLLEDAQTSWVTPTGGQTPL